MAGGRGRGALGPGGLAGALVRLAFLVVTGFSVGLVFGLVTGEPELLARHLKGESEANVAEACATLRGCVGDVKAWCCAQPKGSDAKRGKIEATEKLASGLVKIAHELSVVKSKQGEIIYGRCRVPRFDCGQRVSFLDRSQPGKQAWRDATVLYGGPMLCEIDADGKVCTSYL